MKFCIWWGDNRRREEEEGQREALAIIAGYDWASHDVNDFSTCFRTKVELKDWVERNCILKSPLFKLMACKGNKRIFLGKGNSLKDFFFTYAYLFHELFVRLPFSSFQMNILKVLNIAPSQLHPNSWAYIQAFAMICQVLDLTPTLATFLHYFHTRFIAKHSWVSLIFEQGKALFKLFSLSFKGFKDKIFKVEITEFVRSRFSNEDG